MKKLVSILSLLFIVAAPLGAMAATQAKPAASKSPVKVEKPKTKSVKKPVKAPAKKAAPKKKTPTKPAASKSAAPATAPAKSAEPAKIPANTVAKPTPVAVTPKTFDIDIKNFQFSTKELMVKVGDTVTWTNSDSSPHVVASDPHPIHTEHTEMNGDVQNAGGKFSVTFTKSGTYNYHCHLHPGMRATVIVE